jgi:hypothetical protein
MTRARSVVVFSWALAAAGVVAIAARGLEPPRPGLLPAEASLLPRESGLVAAIDLKRLVASPAYERAAQAPGFVPPPVWNELRSHGLKPERDLRQVIVAAEGRAGGAALALVLGSFERKTLERAFAEEKSTLTRRERKGRTLWITRATPEQKETALAVLADGVLLGGTVDGVTAALDRRAEDTPGILANAGLMALVQQVKPGSTLWLCADQSAFAAAANIAPAAGGWSIPSVKSIVANMDLAPEIEGKVRAETADEPAAKAMAGMLQGMLGLLSMQAGQRPEIRDLVSGLDIRQEGARVQLTVHVRYDTLNRLVPPAAPPPRPVR